MDRIAKVNYTALCNRLQQRTATKIEYVFIAVVSHCCCFGSATLNRPTLLVRVLVSLGC